mmetsp:Transcript_114922/g.321150  ORF Transcript_114922/g.321150 Transcript_114922/m.321150 type:complete len:379 (+) Transcript_114922:69-1205(+)
MAGEGGSAPKHPQQLYFDNVSPATRLLEKRRKMYEVQDALENQKARFAREEEQFRKKEEQLRAKDLQLQQNLIKFNKFLQDNEAKRRRAETRAQEEAAQIRQKDEEIGDLEQQLEQSRQSCSELEEEVARNMKYEEFLERVKETADEFNEIQDLVTRYDTLESANKDLMEVQSQSESKIEDLRKEFSEHRRRQEMEMLEMNNRVAELSSELEDCRKERQQLEHAVDEATQEDSKHSLYFGQILMSVENLFLRCTTKRRNIQHFLEVKEEEGAKGKEEEGQDEGEDSFRRRKMMAIRQLNVILNYLKDFKEITDTLKRERRGTQPQRQGPEIERELTIEFRTTEAPRGDRGSQNSGSTGNTKELTKSAQPSAVLPTAEG